MTALQGPPLPGLTPPGEKRGVKLGKVCSLEADFFCSASCYSCEIHHSSLERAPMGIGNGIGKQTAVKCCLHTPLAGQPQAEDVRTIREN